MPNYITTASNGCHAAEVRTPVACPAPALVLVIPAAPCVGTKPC
jgi:hypothetical protein